MSHTFKDGGLEGAPFVVKTFQLVSDSSTNEIVSWNDQKDSFVVWKPVDFASEILPQYFKHNNFCSFIRQLNTYGFHKVEGKQWEFKHELFRAGYGHLLKDIQRRKSKKRGNEKEDSSPREQVQTGTPTGSQQLTPQTNSSPHSTTPSPATVSVVAKEDPNKKHQVVTVKSEEKEVEVDKLKELNSLLMREIIRLQQQQESTQDVIKQILEQLVESRKETKTLHKKMAKFSTSVSSQLPGVDLISPPLSPAHPADLEDPNLKLNFVLPPQSTPQQHLFSPPLFVNTNAPSNMENSKVENVGFPFAAPDPLNFLGSAHNPGFRSNETFDMNTLDNLLNEEHLITLGTLDLSSNIDQELAKMLQNTLSPPQSPAHHF